MYLIVNKNVISDYLINTIFFGALLMKLIKITETSRRSVRRTGFPGSLTLMTTCSHDSITVTANSVVHILQIEQSSSIKYRTYYVVHLNDANFLLNLVNFGHFLRKPRKTVNSFEKYLVHQAPPLTQGNSNYNF